MYKIVIIEDEYMLRENISTFLQLEGYEVYTAGDGETGINLAKSINPDLIICDIAMPVKDGYAVCAAIQNDKNTEMIPFIFTTAKTQNWEIRKGMELGADDYLTKPFTFDELLNSIKTRIEKRVKIFKKTEENYQLMIENSLTGIFILQNQKIVFVNSKFVEIIGCKQADIIGSNFLNLVYEDDYSFNLDSENRINFEKKVYKEFTLMDVNNNKKYVAIYGGPFVFNNKPSFFGTMLDITERKTFDRILSNTMILAEAEERKRFAADLHDGLGPQLFSIKLHLEVLKMKTKDTNDIIELSNNLEELINTAIESTKEIANNLTPSILDDYGLITAIKKRIEQILMIKEINIYFNSTIGIKRFNKTIEITLYRVVCELINNTLKHANAKNINLIISIENNKLIIQYSDDGNGFTVQSENKNSMGLKNIEGRIKSINGYAEIHSTNGKGMYASISVKL